MNAVINDFRQKECLNIKKMNALQEAQTSPRQSKYNNIENDNNENHHYVDDTTTSLGYNKKLKILLVTETWLPEINGVAHSIYQLAKGLKANGHSILLVRPVQVLSTADSLAEQTMLVKGFAIPRYKTLQFGAPAYSSLKDFFKKNKPDVVHIVTESLVWLRCLLLEN